MFTEEEIAHILSIKGIIHLNVTTILSEYDIDYSDLYLTGGAIASLLQKRAPKDYDFYSETPTKMDELVASIIMKYPDKIAKVDDKYKQLLGKNGLMITANAVTMDNKVSFITKLSGPPVDVKKTFDYVHCTPHFSLRDNKLYISPRQYRACVNKKLIVNNKEAILEYRKQKFIERGYTDGESYE